MYLADGKVWSFRLERQEMAAAPNAGIKGPAPKPIERCPCAESVYLRGRLATAVQMLRDFAEMPYAAEVAEFLAKDGSQPVSADDELPGLLADVAKAGT